MTKNNIDIQDPLTNAHLMTDRHMLVLVQCGSDSFRIGPALACPAYALVAVTGPP